jgi:hypothetical protein
MAPVGPHDLAAIVDPVGDGVRGAGDIDRGEAAAAIEEAMLPSAVVVPPVVKIFKCVEESQSSMMDVEDEHNRMRAAFGLM